MSAAKEELIRLIDSQPEDNSLEDIAQSVFFHIMVLRGLADADAGRVISDADMSRLIKSWSFGPEQDS